MPPLTPEERTQLVTALVIEAGRMEICTARTSNTEKAHLMEALEEKVAWYSYRSEEY